MVFVDIYAFNGLSYKTWFYPSCCIFGQYRFEEGAEQFRIDVAQNPNDTEESIWCFLCEAQLYGVDEARRRFLEVSLGNASMSSIKDMNKSGRDSTS